MPLDPYFAERLRIHRRYLLTQTVRRLRAAVRDLLHRVTAPPAPAPAGGGAAGAGGSAGSRARERHRRAALAWDRAELAQAGTPGPDVDIDEYQVTVPGFPSVQVRAYRPRERSASLPAVLHFYGGAFRIGGIDYPTTDAACRRRAAEARVAVFAVSYALAPEHRFPAQVEQGHAALEWLVREADDLRIDRARVAVSGVSAGGAIAAAVTLMNRDRDRHPVRFQLLEVPVTDLTGRHIDLRPTWAMGVPALLVLRELRSVARTYLRHRSQARHPYASPLLAADHSRLPPALILTAEYDNLRGDGAAYGAALRRSGGDATVVRYLGVTHDTPLYTEALPAAQQWHAQVIAALRALHDD